MLDHYSKIVRQIKSTINLVDITATPKEAIAEIEQIIERK
jgi:hypothetical protein